MGGPLRRGNFNKMSAWPQAVAFIGVPGLHFHDLRHTGNQFAAQSGAELKDLMTRMGHDSERAALIYQHRTSLRDKMIADKISRRVEAERPSSGTQRARDEDDGFVNALGATQGNYRASCAFWLGAGDGNRTRTISLGS